MNNKSIKILLWINSIKSDGSDQLKLSYESINKLNHKYAPLRADIAAVHVGYKYHNSIALLQCLARICVSGCQKSSHVDVIIIFIYIGMLSK